MSKMNYRPSIIEYILYAALLFSLFYAVNDRVFQSDNNIHSKKSNGLIREARAKYVGQSWDGNISLQEEIYDKYGGYLPDKKSSDPELGVYYYDFIEMPITMCIIRQKDGTRFIHDFEKGGVKR